MNKITMFINGKPHTFYQMNLNYSTEQLAHTFSGSIAPLVIDGPLSVEFRLNDIPILIGQIDGTGESTESSAHSISINGRSCSANMIDSRITMDAIYNKNVEELLRMVAKRFGLSVKSGVRNMPKIDEFQVNAESPVENIAQLIREQGFMLIERSGLLTIEYPAHKVVSGIALETGLNINDLTLNKAFNKQFHTIDVQGAWDDANAKITCPGINRARTKVIICDQLQTAEACLSRAKYERDLAIAESLTASTSLADVFLELAINGLNRIIRVTDKEKGFSEMLMIKAIDLSVSESSSKTTLEFSRPFREQSCV